MDMTLGLIDGTQTAAVPQVDDLRGSPLSVGSLEEIIDEK
jgi:hypothetical protein